MKIIVIMLLAVVLSACSRPVTTAQIDMAVDLCAKNGGLKEIEGLELNSAARVLRCSATCNNGAYFYSIKTPY